MKTFLKLQNKLMPLFLFANFLLAKTALAAQPTSLDRLKRMAQLSGYSTADVKPQIVVVEIITYLLGFVGFIFFIMILYAGWQILTSGGNEENIKTAKKRLLHAVIGLAVIIAAYAITAFILSILIKSTTSGYYAF